MKRYLPFVIVIAVGLLTLGSGTILYREQSVWSKAEDARLLFNSYAGMLGLNVDRFKKDTDSEQVKARVTADQQRGAKLGVAIMPAIFLNNRALAPSSLNPASLRAAVDAAVNTKSSP